MVVKTAEGFFVNDRQVKSYDVDPMLRRMSPDQLHKFVEMGNRVKAIQLDNGDYVLRTQGGLNGGGPGLAVVAYVSINIASAAAAASLAWCPPAAAFVALGGHVVATATAVALAPVPTP